MTAVLVGPQVAETVPVVPFGTIESTNVQDALEELAVEAGVSLIVHPTDDTAAIQAKIDAAIDDLPIDQVRQAIIPVELPSGVFNLTAPLRVESVYGFELRGQGDTTQLNVTADMACALDLNGIAHSRFQGFSILGTSGSVADRGLWVRWGTGIGRTTADNHFEDIIVRNLEFKRGIQIGEDAATGQVDSDTWVHCLVRGAWEAPEATLYQSGFYVGTGVTSNNLIHTFVGGSVEMCRRGLVNAASELVWLGGKIQHCESDLHLIGHGGYMVVKGMRSEHSTRLLTCEAPDGTPAHIDLSNIDWYASDLDVDDEMIQWSYGGHLSVRQLYVPTIDAETRTPKIAGVSAGYRYSIDVDSCSSLTPVEDFVVLDSALDSYTIRNYVETDGPGLPTAVTAFVTNGPVLIGGGLAPTDDVGIKAVAGELASIGPMIVDDDGAGGGLRLGDDGNASIIPNGGAARNLFLTGWAALVAPNLAVLEGNSGQYIARSPDGTQYKLTPPNGGGAATWVAV